MQGIPRRIWTASRSLALVALFSTCDLDLQSRVRAETPPPVTDLIAEDMNFANAVVTSIVGGEAPAATLTEDAAENTDTALLYVEGMELLKTGQIAESIPLLQAVSQRPDAPLQTKKYLAVAQLHMRQVTAAQQSIADYLEEVPDDDYAQYVSEIAASASSGADRIASEFDANHEVSLAAMQAPVDATQRLLTVRPPTQAGMPPIGRGARGGASPFNFTVLVASEWDSNVPLRPYFTGLGSNFRHEDARTQIASLADWKLIDRENVNFGLIGSTYDTFQYRLTQFNIEDYMGGAYTNYAFMDDWISSLRYEFHTTMIDDKQFANDHRLTQSITRLGDYGHTTIYTEYNPVDNRAPRLIAAQNQSADNYRVGATQALYTFNGNGRLYGGYQFSRTFAQGTDFDRSSNMATGRFERPLSKTVIADADVRYFWDDYDNSNSLDFFQRARRDNRVELRTGVQKNFKRPVSLRLDYTYIDNNSNTSNLFGVRFYDYSRHVISSQLIFSIY